MLFYIDLLVIYGKDKTSLDIIMAEEVGVEPTRHLNGTSLVLKTRHPTGGVALPDAKTWQTSFPATLCQSQFVCPHIGE